jgi:hypothetical protein
MVRTLAISAVLIAVMAAGPAIAAPFTNGDFESGTDPGSATELFAGSGDITGWTILDQEADPSDSDVTYMGSFFPAQSGSRSVELSGRDLGGIQQTFDVVDGQKYKVSFYSTSEFRHDYRLTGMVQSGTNLVSEDFHATNAGWVLRSFSFVADGTSATLTFLSLVNKQPSFNGSIDNVTIAAVPIPMALPLMAFALGALGVVGWRRRRAPGSTT